MDSTAYPLKREERASLALRALYGRYGYEQYKMSKFEEYDLYVRNKDFLVSEGVITFTDTDGRLMALKPDVTLSIIKNSRDVPGQVQKVYYSESVYRVSGSTKRFREIVQTGLECIGDVDFYHLSEVLSLAAESLSTIAERSVLSISHMGVVSSIVDSLGLDPPARERVLRCIGEKNADGVRALCPEAGGVQALIAARGSADEVIPMLAPWCAEGAGAKALAELAAAARALESGRFGAEIQIDFSVVNDMSYYNGIVFQGFIDGLPSGVLSGGQYDRLMRRMGRSARAVGFAVDLEQLERLDGDEERVDADIVLLYDEGADAAALLEAVRALTRSGERVLAQRTRPEKIRYRRLMRFEDGRTERIE